MDVFAAYYGGRVAWYANDGGNPPGPWVEHIIDGPDGAVSAFAGRVDADADIDFFSAAFNLDEVAWHSNGGNGLTWNKVPITFNCRNCSDVWAADLDADGDNDAISIAGFDGRVDWYENTGVSWVVRPIAVAIAEGVEAADLDQDGDLDVVAGLSWYESDGGSPPTFQPRALPALPNQVVNRTSVLDVDRDGDSDILTVGAAGDRLAWFENNGALPPRFTQHVVSTTADTPTSVYAADLDGDADVDVLSSSAGDNTIAWYENDGASPPSWTKHAISTAAFGARSVFAADLERDGDIDVVSASQWDARIVWHVNESNYPDADHDGVRDEVDCAPADGTAFVVPREVNGARFRSGTLLEWNSAVVGSGSGARYDVTRGVLSQLPPGLGSAETCLANDATARTLTDGAIPTLGTGFYYLVRASNPCGVGSFGAGSSGVPRNTGACP